MSGSQSLSAQVAARFALRELRGGLKGFQIFLACLALGVAALTAVGTVRESILQGLSQNAALLLGGDAELALTYRFADEAERAWIAQNALQSSEITDFRSMAVALKPDGDERALTQIKSVDDAYPLVGEITLEPAMPLSQALGSPGAPGLVMERALIDRLGLEVGDPVRLGTKTFTLTAQIVTEPDNAVGGFALGPRTLVKTEHLDGAGLLQPGTLYETRYRLLTAPGSDLAALKARAETDLATSGLRWTDARAGAPGVTEFVDRLGAFLILVGLSGLAVGGVGVAAAVRAYLSRKTNVIATLKTLGASRQTVFLTYALQIAVLTALGIVLGLIIGAAIPNLLAPVITARLPVPADFGIYAGPLYEAAIYGTLAAALFTLWPLAKADEIPAAALMRDALNQTRNWPRLPYLVSAFVLLALLLGAAMLFSGNVTLTLWTALGILGVLAALSLAAAGIRALAKRLARLPLMRGRTSQRLALGAVSGPREETAAVILSLGLGLSVLSAIGQIDGNLRGAIARDLPEVAPSFFFVDIQNDQLPGFKDRLSTFEAISRIDSAPMLRGVITQINGKPAKETAGDHWVLEGDRGITYSAQKPDNTKVTAGEWWPEDYAGPMQISFAAEEAEEMGLNLNDSLTINVLGRDLTGTITSFREVDFSNAGIGFILSINPSALAGAPHTHISTVYAQAEAETAILRDVATAYPNITAVRVKDAIGRVSDLLRGLASATSYGAAATLLTGFLVLIGAAAAGEAARTYEAALLKTLGASRGTILKSFTERALLLGLSAGAIALVAGIAFSWAVTTFVMDTSFEVIWGNALAIILGGITATLLTSLAFAWRPLKARPAQILRARD
ncbi:MAG: FtsX-like permease family protein [Pseudomonadota bacterium]